MVNLKVVFKSKQDLREAVWAYMEENDLITFPRPCRGRIPNFRGAREAMERLKTLAEWKEATVIFSAPDSSLHPARAEALRDGKRLLVAAPKLTGFYFIKDVPREKAFDASGIKGFSSFGSAVEIASNLPKVDLYLTGAVAVDSKGNRIAKEQGMATGRTKSFPLPGS
jgi:5-formyltetrahydrofolate cyclo-ligase